jgi:hypothetical protein
VSHLGMNTIGKQTLHVYQQIISDNENGKNLLTAVRYAFLAVVFAYYVRILYFLERTLRKHEQRSSGKS